MCRHVKGLKWAQWADPPSFAKRKRARGAKAAGLRFERKVAEELARRGEVWHGQWIEFEDVNGRGLAQPDFILPSEGIVLESKLTETPAAFEQLFSLYLPLLELLMGERLCGVQVCRNLAPVPREARPSGAYGEILDDLAPVPGAVWHYLPI
jgi:hypothetical protein